MQLLKNVQTHAKKKAKEERKWMRWEWHKEMKKISRLSTRVQGRIFEHSAWIRESGLRMWCKFELGAEKRAWRGRLLFYFIFDRYRSIGEPKTCLESEKVRPDQTWHKFPAEDVSTMQTQKNMRQAGWQHTVNALVSFLSYLALFHLSPRCGPSCVTPLYSLRPK